MRNRTVKALLALSVILNLILLWVILARPSLPLHPVAERPPDASAPKNNQGLTRLFEEDQSDRVPENVNWAVVGPRDKAREARAKELYSSGMLQTGADYYHAAMILQHAESPDDYLLAHELCIAAVIKGEEEARWLAAASEDRFLMNIGRPQRFGTQYRTDGPNAEFRLYKVGPGVTNELRRAFDVPVQSEAKAR